MFAMQKQLTAKVSVKRANVMLTGDFRFKLKIAMEFSRAKKDASINIIEYVFMPVNLINY